jgi:hypothetical protein
MSINPQHVVLFHTFRVFLEKAAKRGIEATPLKGAHLLTSVYPTEEDRGNMADVDFLVRPQHWEITHEVLREMGFVQKLLPHRKASEKEFHEAHFHLSISDKEQILFEPHRYLVQPARLKIDYDALWERSKASTFDGAPCRRLAADDHVLHVIVHLVTHFFCLPKTWMRDVELLFTVGGANIDTVVDRAVEWRISRALWTALTLLRESSVSLDFAAAYSRIAPPVPIQACLGFLIPNALGFRFPNLCLRAKEALLWPVIFDSAFDFGKFAAHYAAVRMRDLR